MISRTVKGVSIVSALALVVAAPLSAQLVNGKWQAPAKTGGSGAGAPRQGVQTRNETGAESRQSAQVNNGAVPVRVIHAVVMSDGGIYADFGSGLEPVRRACPSAVSSMPLRVVGGEPTTQPAPGLQTVPGIQPAPNQATASELALSPTRSRSPSQAARSSCHLRDQRGRAFATR
ncbi:MAG: hypothetical protein AABZ80_01100 [Gemmatimonadota bacterium]